MNVPQTTTEYLETLRQALQRDTTLRQLAAKATERYAGEAVRLNKGLTIALNHGVTFLPDGTALVKSQRDAEVVYEVKAGRCDCSDAERAPEFRCKHRWAACFSKKATAQMPKPLTYYATYYTTEETWLQGTATYLDARGWVFRDEDDSIVIAYADHASLVLGGRVDLLAEADRADGDLVRKVCGY